MGYRRNRCPIGLLIILLVPGVHALEYDYSLYSSAEYSDNIRQGGLENDISGSILRGGVGANLATDAAATLAADLSGDFSKVYYSEGGLETEDRKRLDARLLYQPASSNFRLAVLDSLRQVQEDRRSVRAVNNLRDVNILSVVPSYSFDLTSVSTIVASYSYSRIDDELDLSSRDVESVTVGYQYNMSNLSDLSVHASRSNIEFTDTGQQLDQESAFFRWAYTGVLTNWMLDLGRQNIVQGQDVGTSLISFSVDRQVNNFSQARLFYRQGYSDLVNSNVGGRLVQIVPNIDAVFADELAREKQLALSYDITLGALEGRLGLDARRMQSEEAVSFGRPIDEDRYTASTGLDYRFRSEQQNLSAYGVGASYRYVEEEFKLENESNQINEAAVRVNYFATRSSSFYFEIRSRDTAGTAPRSDTDEKSVLVGFRFSPRGGG